MKRPTLTREQRLFAYHRDESFLEACPGSGKTRAIVGRICRISRTLQPRKGIAILSFTNTAVDEFKERCRALGLESVLRHPGFVGTFDAFVRHFFVLPAGIPGVRVRPIIVDSWKSLGIEVRLRGKKAFSGSGVPLDSFDALEGTIDPDVIGRAALKAHVQEHRSDYEQAASSRRQGLQRKGYLSAADARVVACKNLKKEGWADNLGKAIAARFQEMIVDEAQDCNPLDLALLDWLRAHGLSVTVVCDPDQAIYSFRQGNPNPAQLKDFASRYNKSNRLSLTGNFRSSGPICSIAATLREREDPDEPVGDNSEIAHPIHVVAYADAAIPSFISSAFSELAAGVGINSNQSIILAHKRRTAYQAAGVAFEAESGGASKVAIIANAIGSFWSSSGSNRAKDAALRDVESLILQLMGRIEDGEPVTKAVERNEIDGRWLRRSALEFVMSLPRTCEQTDAGRATWLAALHASVRQLRLEYGDGITETSFFTRRGGQGWSQSLQQLSGPAVRCATVHEAKGREYDAVCLVIPPNRKPLNHTEQLFEAWEQRVNDEAKRVAYVGITRAKKLVAVAVPCAYRRRMSAILDGAGVRWELHDLTAFVCPVA